MVSLVAVILNFEYNDLKKKLKINVTKIRRQNNLNQTLKSNIEDLI